MGAWYTVQCADAVAVAVAAVVAAAVAAIVDASTKGRWWKVGSKWQQKDLKRQTKDNTTHDNDDEGTKLNKLAHKQRMNTDIRRSIFVVLMSANDYTDAFEKMVKLGLKGKQEREMVRVVLDCCGQEKFYNPYYAHVAVR